jgi:PhnB protein
MSFLPYIFFDGNAEKAFDFYAKATGGKVTYALTYGDSPMSCGPMDKKAKNRLAHICLDTSNGPLMGADVPPGCWQGAPQGFSVNFAADTPAKAKKTFAALMKGGKIHMPMEETFYAKAFGMGVDKFGTPWMVICPKPDAKTKKRKAAK